MRTPDDAARIAVMEQLSSAIAVHRLKLAKLIYYPVEFKDEEQMATRLRRQYELERDNPEPVPVSDLRVIERGTGLRLRRSCRSSSRRSWALPLGCLSG